MKRTVLIFVATLLGLTVTGWLRLPGPVRTVETDRVSRGREAQAPRTLLSVAKALEPTRRGAAEPGRATGLEGSSRAASSPESTLADFARWVEGFRASGGAGSPELIAEGVRRARARRVVLGRWIETNPRAALAAAAPGVWYRELPAEVVGQLEERIHGRGDLDVFCAAPPPLPGGDYGRFQGSTMRYVRIEGRTFRAYVYGRRRAQRASRDLPLHGIAVGKAMAVHEDALRRLEAEDVATAASGTCGYCGQGPASGEAGVHAMLGDQVLTFCGVGHVAAMSRVLGQAELERPAAPLAAGLPAPPPNPQPTFGLKRVLYMRLAFADDTDIPNSEEGALADLRVANDFYVAASYGKTALMPTVTTVLTLPQPKMYYAGAGPGGILVDALLKALAAGHDAANYDELILRHTPVPGFEWGGLGGGGVSWLQYDGAGIAIHELGHNYGLGHANFWDTRGEIAAPNPPPDLENNSLVGHDSVYGPGEDVEYGDIFDVMGSGPGHFNPVGKSQLAWLPAAYVVQDPSTGTNRIHVHDTPTLVEGRAYALLVTKDTQRRYWLSARETTGANAWAAAGMELHLGPWQQGMGYSSLLDTTPGSAAGRDDSPLLVGRTFSDPESGVHITPVAMGGAGTEKWFDVVVRRGPFTNNTAPSVSLSASSLAVPLGTPVTFTATASDVDGDPVAYSWDFGYGDFDLNRAQVSRVFTRAGDHVVRCEVSDLKGGVTAKHVVVTVGGARALRIAGRVLDNQGFPLRGVRVHNGDQTNTFTYGDNYQWTLTDSDGAFTLVNLAAGPHRVEAYLHGYEIAPLNFDSPLLLDAADAGGVELLALPWTRVTVRPGRNADRAAGTPGEFILTRDGEAKDLLRVYFWLEGEAQPDTQFGAYTNVESHTNILQTPFGPSTQVFTFYYTDFLPEVQETKVTLLVLTNGTWSGAPRLDLTLVYPVQQIRLSITNTNVVDLPGWEVRGIDNVDTYVQTRPDYLLTWAASAAIEFRGTALAAPAVGVVALDSVASEQPSDGCLFVLVRSGSTTTPLTVNLETGGSATAGSDYGAPPGSVTIPAGQSHLSIPLTIIQDSFLEGTETVELRVLPGAGYLVSETAALASAQVVDDDMPLVAIRPLRDAVVESDPEPATLLVTRLGDASSSLTVNYLVSGDATSGVDYQPLSGAVTFPAWSKVVVLPVVPINDRVVDGRKTVTVLLSDSPLYNVGPPGHATVVLQDAALPSVTVSAADAAAGEGGDTGQFLFTRSGDLTRDLVVQYRVGGTATPLADFTALGSAVRFPAGVGQVALTVTPVDDGFREMDENVVVELLASANYNLAPIHDAVVTITDNDTGSLPAVGFNLLTSSGPEGDEVAWIAVTVSGNPAENADVTVDYRVTGGTALADVDYDSLTSTGRLEFLHIGDAEDFSERTQLIEIGLLDNDLLESNRTLLVSLIAPFYSVSNELVTNEITITNILGEPETTNEVTTNIIVNGTPMNAQFDVYANHTFTILDDDAAEVFLEVVTDEAREAGTRAAWLVLHRTGPTNRAQVVTLDIGGDAAGGSDYQALPTTVTIPAGLDSIDLWVVPVDDPVQEYPETVRVSLVHLPGARFGEPYEAVITIVDNDGTIEFPATHFSTTEGTNETLIPVRRTGDTSRSARVTFTITAGTAAAGEDFVATNGVLDFAAGQTEARMPVVLVDDDLVEGAETIQLRLANPAAGGPLGGQSVATLTVIDDDSGVRFAAASFRVNENTANAVITLERVGLSGQVVDLEYLLLDDTATNGVDFLGTTGRVSFAAGELTRSFNVRIRDDVEFEGDESLWLVLTNVSAGASIQGDDRVPLVIVDDECALEFGAATSAVSEYGRTVNLEVRRTGGTVNAVEVTFATTNLTATAGLDYKAVQGSVRLAGDAWIPRSDGSGQVDFQSGATNGSVQVRILDDVLGEGDETFEVRLSGPRLSTGTALAGSAILGLQSNSVVTIVDNETPGNVDYEFHPGDGANAPVWALGLQADGKVVVGGEFTKVNGVNIRRIARVHEDGYLDSFFNPGAGFNAPVRALSIQADGRILAGGEFTQFSGTTRNRLIRLNADGSQDADFDPGSGANATVSALASQPDGGILVGGEFTQVNGVAAPYVARLSYDGAVDAAFAALGGADGPVRALAVLPDGRVLAGGSFSTLNGSGPGLARLNADGTVDTTFAVGSGPDGTVRSIAVQGDGRLVIGGDFTSFNGVPRPRVARLEADGALDVTFNPGTGANAPVYGVAVQPDGKVVLAGDFTQFNGMGLNRIARLNPTGSVDSGFDVGTGANDTVRALALQPNTAFVIGGEFTVVRDLPRARFARLHGDDRFTLGRVEFVQARYEVGEGTPHVTLTVTRSGDLAAGLSVDLVTADGSATGGEDYTAPAPTLTFDPGASEQTVEIPVLDDVLGEGDETFRVSLTNLPSGFDLTAQLTSTVVIVDDESAVAFVAAAASVGEGEGGVVLTVRRSGSTTASAQVEFTTRDGSALAGADYGATTGTVMFAAGEVERAVEVIVLEDDEAEPGETFRVALLNPTGGLLLGSQSEVEVTIVDNDSVPFYALNITPPVGGTVTPPSGLYPVASTQVVSAVALPDFVFLGWEGSVTNAENPLTLVMDRTYTLTALFRPRRPSFDFEPPFGGANLGSTPWTVSGAAPWQVVPGMGQPGVALRSGPITDHQQSGLDLVVDSRAGVGFFDFHVSSEKGWDFLEFFIDGVRVQRWSGESAWRGFAFNLTAGRHTLSWRYFKDANFSSGLDAAFIDNLFVPAALPGSGDAAVLSVTVTPGTPAQIGLQGTVGFTYVTEATPDLVTWTPIATNALSSSPATVVDAASTNAPLRFYRALAR